MYALEIPLYLSFVTDEMKIFRRKLVKKVYILNNNPLYLQTFSPHSHIFLYILKRNICLYRYTPKRTFDN